MMFKYNTGKENIKTTEYLCMIRKFILYINFDKEQFQKEDLPTISNSNNYIQYLRCFTYC